MNACAVHDFKEEYYGWRCAKCGQFYPNTAPLEAWILGDPTSRDNCLHEPIAVENDEGLLDCVKCRYCGEVMLP